MPTLATCIRKAGKALNRADADAIRAIYDDLRGPDMDAETAAKQAVAEYLDTMADDRTDIETQIEEQGGVLPGEDVIRFAADNTIVKRVAKALNITNILDGDETLVVEPTGDREQPVMRDVAMALEQRTKRINKDLEERTDEAKEILATALADEVAIAMERSGHAGHWYSDKLRNAVALAAEIHPELAEDSNAQAMFLAALAITSNGQPVAKNAELAEQAYAEYKETGKFPDLGVGKEAEGMKKGFATLNGLISELGLDKTREFLATEWTRRELMDIGFGNAAAGESTTFSTHGSAVFGPKVGSGFFQNLIGNYDPLTIDRWFMRTWGRLTGKLIEDPYSSANVKRRERLRASLTSKKGQQKLAEMGYTGLDLSNDSVLDNLAVELHMEYARTDFKDKSEWNLAAKNLDEGMNNTIGTPSGPSHRAWIRSIVVEAQSKLKQRGLDVDTASLQALIWYPEKELYQKYGVGDAKAKPTDYEQEFARIAEERGIGTDRIRRILRRKTGRGTRSVRSRRATEAEAIRKPLGEKERRRFLADSGVRAVRRTGRTTHRGRAPTGRKGLVVDGASVTTSWKPEVFAKNQWTRTGVSSPTLHELDTTSGAVASAETFTRAIEAAKASHPQGAAVYVYPLEDYEGMRLFLTEDGKAGFALQGDDIVSAFKHADVTAPDIVQSMVALAVQQGGRRLDAFDTVLPFLYELQGFKVVSRLAWDETQAPPDWNKDDFARFNNGEPDVVFMVWDPDNYNDYTGEGTMVETYDEAVALQEAARDELMYPDIGSMRARIEDDVKEDFVDENPSHPHSVLWKMAATVEDQAQHSPSAVEVIKDRVTNAGDKAIDANLALIHRNYLNDFMPDDRLSEISVYNHEIRVMEGRKGELMLRYEPTARKMYWHKARSPEDHARLGEAMFHATINGLDPSKPYQPLKKRENMTDADKKADALRRAEYKVLKDFYDNQLSTEARELFEEVRDNYAHLRTEMETAIESRIEQAEASDQAKRQMLLEMRQLFEAGRVQGPYFPLDRWGDRWGVAYNEDGEVYSFSKFETKSDAMAWKENMEEAGFTVKTGKKLKDDFSMAQAIDPSLVARIQKMVAGVEGGEKIADEMYQIYLRSLPEMSMRKHFIHRKGRIGFSENILRSYAAHMFHGSTQVARMEQQPKLEQSLRRLREQVQAAEELNDAHSDWAAPLYNEMVVRHKLAMDPPRSAWSSWATNLGFGWLLGVTPGAAILNLFQTPMFGMPTVAARPGNGTVATTIEFAKAIGEYFSTRIGGYKSKLRNDELKAYEWAEKTGIFSKTMSHDLADLIDKDESAYGVRRSVMTMVSFLFHHTEQANRNVTFMAAYRMARKRGLDHEAALYDAADLNDRSHYDYSASNRPPLMQNEYAKVLLLFKNYGVHSTYQISRAMKDGFFAQEGLPPEKRAEARRKFTGIMMMTAVLGGVSSLPLAFLVEKILNMIFGDEDEPYDAGNEFKVWLVQDQGWSVAQANALVNGGWDQLTGGTMSSRISLSYLGLAREAYQPLEGRDLMHHILEEVAGPVPSIMLSPIIAAQDIKEGRVERGIEKMVPKFARDMMRAVRYNAEGAKTYSDEPILLPEQFTDWDLFMQAMGMTPNKLMLRYEQNRELKNMNTRLTDRRTFLMDKFWMAIQYGDAKEQAEASAAAMKWNMAHPEWIIGIDELKASALSRRRMSQQTFGGVALNPRLDIQLRKEMTWLPVETGEPVPKPPGVKQ
jgi:hypothetical protein